MIAIIDYGMGNLGSVYNALRFLGVSASITDDPKDIRTARALILPGVGAMRSAMINMRERGLDDEIRLAVRREVPFLGICLGMQLLFSRSEEETAKGLDILPGIVRRIPPVSGLKIPHMGWNQIRVTGREQSGDGLLHDRESVYFVHSYYADPENRSIVTATTDHGTKITAAVGHGNIDAFQFHPEKSGDRGLEILWRWLKKTGEIV